MSRRIVWYNYESSEPEWQIDGYFDRLLKYIPADVVGLWLTGNGLIQSQADDEARSVTLWLLFIVGLALSFFWTYRQTVQLGKPTPWRQILLSCISFVVWVFAIGGPFAEISIYKPFYGSFVLLIYTSIIPLLPAPPVLQR